MVDFKNKNDDNSSGRIVISNNDETMVINKKDLVWNRVSSHEHHYLPDFTDETDTYIALTCAKGGCIHGRLQRKEGRDFIEWLNKHRA